MTYVVMTVVLLLMTAMNIVFSMVNLRGLNSTLSLGIATVEAVIMALVFMRLRSSPAVTRLVGIAGLLWLAILMVGTLDDVLTRGWLPVPGK